MTALKRETQRAWNRGFLCGWFAGLIAGSVSGLAAGFLVLLVFRSFITQ